MKRKRKILVIVGPTASGKSALAVGLAKKFNGEIISADSRQVYTGLDIGTGKITKREMNGVRHYMLDIASPKKKFSAHDYLVRGTNALTATLVGKKLPMIVGGTGYYIDALVGRIVLPDVAMNAKLRKQLEKRTPKQLFALLKKRDPRRAATIEPHHKRRLIRALEIAAALGKNPMPRERSEYDVLWIGIAPTLKDIEKNIEKRLHARIRRGMIGEAKRIHAAGLPFRRMEELGLEYRSLARYLQNVITKEEMTAELNRDIRRYAKKQLAYWKRNKDINWFKPKSRTAMMRRVRAWLGE